MKDEKPAAAAPAVPQTVPASADELPMLKRLIEETIMVAKTDEDADGFISAYHFKTGAIHRLLAAARGGNYPPHIVQRQKIDDSCAHCGHKSGHGGLPCPLGTARDILPNRGLPAMPKVPEPAPHCALAEPVEWPSDCRPPFQVMEGRTLLHIETHADNPIGAGIPVCSIPKKKEALADAIVAACNAYTAPPQASAAVPQDAKAEDE